MSVAWCSAHPAKEYEEEEGPISNGPRMHGQCHPHPPLLDNGYTGGDNVDIIYHKDAKNVVYSSCV